MGSVPVRIGDGKREGLCSGLKDVDVDRPASDLASATPFHLFIKVVNGNYILDSLGGE